MYGAAPTEPLVFPVGHYQGPFFPDVAAPMAFVRLRIGRNVAQLFTEDEVALWALAHGVPDELDSGPWTLEAMGEAAVRLDRMSIGGALDVLLDAGVLVEVVPGSPESVEFARSHMFRSLLVGLGAEPTRPGMVALGLRGQPGPFVDESAYEIWQWAPSMSSLWDACELLAEVGASPFLGGRDAEKTLRHVLERLHVLLASGAGYLDRVDKAEWAAQDPSRSRQLVP